MKTKTACKKMRFPPMASRLYPPEGCKNSPQGPVFAFFKRSSRVSGEPYGPICTRLCGQSIKHGTNTTATIAPPLARLTVRHPAAAAAARGRY